MKKTSSRFKPIFVQNSDLFFMKPSTLKPVSEESSGPKMAQMDAFLWRRSSHIQPPSGLDFPWQLDDVQTPMNQLQLTDAFIGEASWPTLGMVGHGGSWRGATRRRAEISETQGASEIEHAKTDSIWLDQIRARGTIPPKSGPSKISNEPFHISSRSSLLFFFVLYSWSKILGF